MALQRQEDVKGSDPSERAIDMLNKGSKNR
jgi:hypothetical protein